MREENAAAALEVMSRFAVDPRWLLYLPPTMSPVATSPRAGPAGAPGQAFDAYRADGVATVVCEEKHMGSRAVALVCRDAGGRACPIRRARRRARRGAGPGPAGRSSRPALTDRAASDRLRDGGRARPGCSTSSTPTGCCWTPSCCRGAPRPTSCCARSTRRSAPRPRAALPGRGRPRWQAAARAGSDVGELLARTSAPAGRTPTRSPTPTAATAGPPTGWTACALAPFQLLATEGAHLPRPAARLAPRPGRPAGRRRPDAAPATRRLSVDPADEASMRRGDRLVGRS